ncbi:hypothetical protein [Celeribacter neptunius]|uniref:Lipoprotein n=1 Tax=Celeribacter neptunius TaxID=588602 RepID=A0A1I3LT05_9RHOB|nr:hypothetical protein [Celeribacter neptunius]SFI87586.1 hypothetical protein SAMN04487991_1128 [Celeribacter neptunius]
MKKLILPAVLATMALSACAEMEKYPVSQCTTADHYPVACQEIEAGQSPADLEPVSVPDFKGA